MKYKKSMKRFLSLLLVLAMLLSGSNISGVLQVYAADGKEDLTYGALLAKNATELDEAAKAILESGLLTGEVISYQKPTNEDDLVQVDAVSRTIQASPYQDSQGNVWTITACRVVYTDGQEEIALTDGEGSFAYAGDAYTVQVDYQLSVTADAELTERLLKTPAWLAQGADNLAVLCGDEVQDLLKVLAENQTVLEKIANGYDLYGPNGTLVMHVDLTCKANAQNLLAQCSANGGKLDLQVMADACQKASQISYLMNQGADMKDCAEKAYADIQAIYNVLNDQSTCNILITYSGANEAQLTTMRGAMGNWMKAVADVLADPWTMLDNADVLKADMTAAEYAQLDTLVKGASKTEYAGAIPTELVVETATVEKSTNRYTVTVAVEANVIDSNALETTDTVKLAVVTDSFKLNVGASGTELAAQVEALGVEAKALSAWDANYGIGTTNYTRTTSVTLDANYSLTGDLTYTITYQPKDVTVTYGDGFEQEPATVPYGYQLKLPVYDGDQIYDYKVNGADYDQASVIRITTDTTISREVGKAWEKHGLGQLIADNYLSEDAVGTSLLTSVALVTGSFRLRTPDDSSELLSIERVDGQYVVTAKTYKANTGSLQWIPVSATLIGAAADTEVSFAKAGAGTYTATISGDTSFDQVEVTYQVELTWADLGISEEDALALQNLPNQLTTEAVSQLSAMSSLNNQYSNLGQVNQNLNAIKLTVNGSELPQECKDAVKNLIANCVSDSGNLYVYDLLTEYQALSSDGARLAFYYRNYDGVYGLKNQIDQICDAFEVLAVDYKDDFTEFLESLGYGQYAEKIDRIYETLQKVQNSAVAPNAAIDTTSASLTDLATLVAASRSTTTAYTAELAEPVLTTTLAIDAPNRLSVSLQVQKKNSDGIVIGTATKVVSFEAPEGIVTLTAEQAAVLNAQKAELVNTILPGTADQKHYVTADSRIYKEGDVITTATNTDLTTYGPAEYKVTFVDAEGVSVADAVTFPFDNPVISLEAAADGYRYDYTIDGKTVSTATYTFTTAQLDTLFDANGIYAVTRTIVDVTRETVDQLVIDLNEALYKAGTITVNGKEALKAAFLSLEDSDGNLSIVLRVSPTSLSNAKGVLEDAGLALINTSFDYIGLGDSALKQDDKVYLQSVIDVLLNSGLGLSTITELIDSTGDIQEMTLAGLTSVGVTSVQGGVIYDPTLLGGKLLETSIVVGSDADAGLTIPFYVTVEDYDCSADSLLKIRNLANRIGQYVDITAEDGSLNVELKLTDGQYAAVITGLLATELASTRDITEVDPVEIVHYLYDIAADLPEDTTITGTTLTNTLEKFDITKDLSIYDTVAPILRNVLANTTVTNEKGEGDTYSATLTYDINALLDRLNLGDLTDTLRSMLAETETGISGSVSVKVDNLGKSYQAVVVDPGVSGLRKLSYYTTAEELQNALTNQKSSNAIVVLLADYEGTLTTSKRVFLDLNGKTLDGDLIANGTTIVLDGSANHQGLVTGSVSGAARITAGQYEADVTAYLPEGYQQTDKAVTNVLYSWAEDADGNYILSLNGDALKLDSVPSVKYLAVELATDIALKHFSSAAVTMDDYTIYSVQYEDLLALLDSGIHADTINQLLACIQTDEITALANDLIDALTDLEALNEAMQSNDGIVKEYTMTTQAWSVEIEHVTEGDYLTANLVPAETTVSRNVTLRIQDNEEGEVAALVEKIKDVLTVDAEVKLDDLQYADRGILVSGSASADVVIDLTGDPNYAAVVAVILANGTTGTVRSDLIDAVTTYSTTGKTADLKTAIEAVTTEELVKALKQLERDGFEELLDSLGLEDLPDATELEAVYDDMIVMVGQAASYLKLSGGDRTIGSFADAEEYGTYNLEGTYSKTRSGRVQLSADAALTLQLKLVKEDTETPPVESEEPEEPIVPEEYSVTVENADGEELYKGDSLKEAFAAITEDGCTIILTKEASLEDNVELAKAVHLLGARLLDANGYSILLTNADARLTADADLSDVVSCGLWGYQLVVSGTVYSLELQTVTVYDSNNNGIYAGEDLNEAFKQATADATIRVNKAMSLNREVTVDRALQIVGASLVNQNGQAILLTIGGSLKTDAELTVTTNESFYEVVRSDDTYQLSVLLPKLTGSVSVTKNASIAGSKVNADGGYIILDTDPNGVTAAVVQASVSAAAINADKVTYSIKGTNAGKVINGAKLTVTASNSATSVTDTKVYTIIILGDTNCDGVISSGDAVIMMRHYIYGINLSTEVQMAADVNQSGKVESGDAVRNATKFTYLWDQGSYQTALK